MAEIIEIGLNDEPKNLTVSDSNDKGTIKLSGLSPASSKSTKSVNFGPGADLLMNPSRKSNPNSPKSDLGLSELNNITLDDVGEIDAKPPSVKKQTRTSLFAEVNNKTDSKPLNLNINEIGNSRSEESKKTGEKVNTPEKKTIHFKMSKDLFKKLNNNEE